VSWRLARSLERLRDEVRGRWPGTTIWALGDTAHASRASDHNPSPDGVVCAIDIVGKPQAQAVWNLIASTRPERVKYMIFNRQIMSSTTSPWQARPYTGANGHLDHVHVSVGRGPDGSGGRPDLFDDRSGWFEPVPVTAPPPKDEIMSPAQEAKLDRLAKDVAALTATVTTMRDGLENTHLRPLRRGVRALLGAAGINVDGGP
jgi:hypothetical protein